MRTLLPEDSIIDLAEFPGVPEEWQREIRVRGRLTIDEIGRLYELEQEIRAGVVASATDPAALREPLEQAYEQVMMIFSEQNPGLPRIPLDVEQTMRVMAWLAGADSVGDAVDEALRAGRESSQEAPGADAGEDGTSGIPDGETATDSPLRSPKRSPKRSSRSAKGSPGGRSGGTESPGAPSSATASTSTARRVA
jgi:hypothetical protein